MAVDQLSVEEFLKKFPSDNDIQELLALNSVLSGQNYSPPIKTSCVPYDGYPLIDPRNCDIGKNDLDVYLCKGSNSKGQSNDTSDHLALNNDLFKQLKHTNHVNAHTSSKSTRIPLSSSVAVPVLPKSQYSSPQIELVHPLEEKYKARYKSDYFSQHGTQRKPRYVADQSGNHYVSVKVPPGTQGYIRIDWVTLLNEHNIRYSMPYKFQINNDVLDNSDANPIYAPIIPDKFGIVKLYLVLIKAKQDELKANQSFEQFPPVYTPLNMDNSKPIRLLPAKQLIQKYQLDKSQLAFTVTSISPDGKSFVADWNTTVYSTVITEMPSDTSKKRKITCPSCSHSFDITTDSVDDIVHENVLKKRKQEL